MQKELLKSSECCQLVLHMQMSYKFRVQILGYVCQDRGDKESMCLLLVCTFLAAYFYIVSFPGAIRSQSELKIHL